MEDNMGGLIAGGILGMGIMAIVLIALVWYILQVIAYWKIFTKAGKPGWHSIIPVLNKWDELDLSWSRKVAWLFIILALLSAVVGGLFGVRGEDGSISVSGFWGVIYSVLGIASGVILLVGNYKLAKAFGKGFGFFLGLLFLNPIFMLILGFGSAQYQGPQG